ncbi:YhgE/Pip domain-containing protein [Streptomyces sp. NPDC002055]|uniref:YhgE/Pip domain-containing protein n=1 Tax=Streptomyces sp. NPDC002055 TaxID=3154534 RepID=UPI003329C97C
MRSPKLAALELKRFGRGKLPRAALVALLLLPLLYGALYLWSFWDPYGHLEKIPVALVNSDRGASAKGEKVTAGHDIVDGLRDSNTFEWHEVSPAEAKKGVEEGKYYLSMTVPGDFSKRVVSSSGEHPETGALQVRTNDSNNYIVGQISRSVFSEVRRAASTKSSRSFLDKIFVAFSDIHGKTVKAAKGADKLDGGIGKAKKGSGDLARGLADAKKGSASLKDGLAKIDVNTGRLEEGSGKVADGTQQFADKARRVKAVEPFLKEHGAEIGRYSRIVADASLTIRGRLDELPSPTTTQKVAEDSREAADYLTQDYEKRCTSALLPETSCANLKKAADAAEKAAKAAAAVDKLVQNKNGELDKLSRDLNTIHTIADQLADRAPTLWKDIDSGVKQVNALNAGAHKVSRGLDALHTGTGKARTGINELDTGIGKLSTGANSLNGGMFKLADGSGKLAGGLHDGAEQIPDYGKKERDARTEVMADPVRLASNSMHKAPNYGTGFAPYFIPLSLWVGAMVAYMLIQPLNRRALAAGASAWRIALAGWLPVAVLGIAQMGALMAVLHWGLGLEMAHAGGTIGFLALVTVCFAAIVQWLNARFGPAGRILVLALLMLQLTSAGGTYPVQTSPGFFNAIHPFLPMTYVVEGLRRLITGGGLDQVWLGSAVLAAYTVGALALTAWSARRKQVWTLDRLHPELSL